MCSTRPMVVGDDDEAMDSGQSPEKGMMKFANSRKFQDDSFLPDALRIEAPLLDSAPEARVACTTVFTIGAGDSVWKNTRNREKVR